MGLLILGLFVALAAIVAAWFVPLSKVKTVLRFCLAPIGLLIAFAGGVEQNPAGYCSHIKTIFNTETYKCDYGWYFQGWGTSTQWPHFITVTNTADPNAEGSSVNGPYSIRMADNWSGDITQTTRFGIPQDRPQFLKMARDFRSPARLITSTLQPAVQASLDSTANFFTMEEYYAGGQRDAFKTEFSDSVKKGRAAVIRVEVKIDRAKITNDVSPNNNPDVEDTASTGSSNSVRYHTKKKLDLNGNEIRIPHGYASYGIVASTAIAQNLDPDDVFEKQIQERKDAAARRSVAREKRFEEEEQRLLAIASGEKNIATRQAEARTEQIEKTTNAETTKRLALIEADQRKQEARIAKETAQLALERAEIDARAVKVLADAEAYKKKAIIEADNALAFKGELYRDAQKVWAEAYAKRQVPSFVMGGSPGQTGSNDDVSKFMQLLMMSAAKDLDLDLRLNNPKKQTQK